MIGVKKTFRYIVEGDFVPFGTKNKEGEYGSAFSAVWAGFAFVEDGVNFNQKSCQDGARPDGQAKGTETIFCRFHGHQHKTNHNQGNAREHDGVVSLVEKQLFFIRHGANKGIQTERFSNVVQKSNGKRVLITG